MAPVNDQITSLERCERAVERVFARMEKDCRLDFDLRDQFLAQMDLQFESSPKAKHFLLAA